MKPYDYARRSGVYEMSWRDFAELCTRMAELLEPFRPDLVVGNARGGLFPATQLAIMLRKELIPVRLSRRVDDEVVYEEPTWRVPLAAEVAGKTVAVVDDIVDTGTTLRILTLRAHELGAGRVVTAALASHSWAEPSPDVSGIVTDAFVIFPWDRQVLVKGQWAPHPEIAAALEALEEGDAAEA